MKTKLILVSAFLLVVALVFTFTASATIPHLVNYQGKATDKTGIEVEERKRESMLFLVESPGFSKIFAL